MNCPKCGASCDENALLCPVCGALLAEDAEGPTEPAEIDEPDETQPPVEQTKGPDAEGAAEDLDGENSVEEDFDKEADSVPADHAAAEYSDLKVDDRFQEAPAEAEDMLEGEPAKKKRLGAGTVIGLILAALAVIFGVLFALSYYDVWNVPGISSLTDAIKGKKPTDSSSEVPGDYDPTKTVLTASGYEFDGAFFTLVYQTVYNRAAQEAYYQAMYGMTPTFDTNKDPAAQTTTDESGNEISYHDFFLENAVKTIEQNAYYRRLAEDNSLSLDESYLAQIESTVDGLKEAAGEDGVELDAYLTENFCPGVTEETVRQFLETAMLAEVGENYEKEAYMKTLDADALWDGLTDRRDYLQVDFRIGHVRKSGDEQTDDDNRARMQKVFEAITDEASFNTALRENLSQADAETFAADDSTLLPGMSYAYVSQNIDEEIANWLFADGRKQGDKEKFETDNFYFVILLKTPAYREDSPSVNVRHALALFQSVAEGAEEGQETAFAEVETLTAKDGTTVTNEGTAFSGWVVLETYEKAKALYDEYLSGDKTEQSFAAIATENSEDGGSASNGGLYENVAKGQMVPAFDAWIFDPARKPGDTGLVKTNYGWHVMYYVDKNAEPDWAMTLKSAEADKYAASQTEKVFGSGARTKTLPTAADAVLAVINRQRLAYLAELEAATATDASTEPGTEADTQPVSEQTTLATE